MNNNIDIKAFQNDSGLDYDMLNELYTLFSDELLLYAENINNYMLTNNRNDLNKVIHDIKGIASSYKAKRLYEKASVINEKLKNGELDGIDSMIGELMVLINEVVVDIKNEFGSVD